MRRSRIGFSLIEMLMVVVIIGVILAFGLPKFNSLRNSGKIGAAKVHLSSSITTARAAAIQNGRASAWTVSGNTVAVSAQNAAGVWVNLQSPAGFDSLYNVALRATQDQIIFDSRGIAANMTGTNKIYIVGATTDSVCVTMLGVVLRHGCL